MIEQGANALLASRVASIYLDYGVDAQACDPDAIEISERGLILRSRWKFEIGMQLSVALVAEHPRLGHSRIAAEGIVVWCEAVKGEPKMYESTVLFLEPPDDLKQSLREFSRP
jgi:hypothetical protein